MFQRIANSTILTPSREEIPASHKLRRTLAHGGGEIELWIESVECEEADQAKMFVLKFGGQSSRAERATAHPLDFWTALPAQVWAMNYPGFGGSSGPAGVLGLATAGVAVYEEMRQHANGRPILITGNSLGTVVALHVAARFRDMAGLLLRNPPPLRQLIVGRHGWYSAWIGAWLVARRVPRELDSIQNARGSDVPAVFVTCGADRMVPPRYQTAVFDAYAGPKRRLILADADHADLPNDAEQREYRQLLDWLKGRAGIP